MKQARVKQGIESERTDILSGLIICLQTQIGVEMQKRAIDPSGITVVTELSRSGAWSEEESSTE